MDYSIQEFYQHLAPDYHFIFRDWEASVRRQGDVLDGLIRAERPDADSVLDCACGIGTQAIGLALHGYNVRATDLSPAAVRRARTEARNFGVKIFFGDADFRDLAREVDGTFDVVLACDNSIAHLLTDGDLTLAAASMREKLLPGGLLILSIRDYDALVQEKPRVQPPNILDTPEGRRVSFQVWDWAADGRSYTLSHFILKQSGERWATTGSKTQLRALQRAEVTAVLERTGFENICWHMPDETGYHQPLVTARRG
ncbi:MAG: class I SAM-dependent methyltransferase [Anaerolineae bacterium]|nr:class I SAM-dependent methyltransferase [Anaerolineae bacterium]